MHCTFVTSKRESRVLTEVTKKCTNASVDPSTRVAVYGARELLFYTVFGWFLVECTDI